MTAPHVVGLDLSLSGTGVAHADGTTETLRPKPAAMRGGPRLIWLRDRLTPAFLGDHLPGRIDLVVIEDYAPGSIGISGKLANAQLRGVVEAALAEHSPVTAVAFIKPNVLKRWATGNGGADKGQMVAAAVAAGWAGDPKRHDEADAFHLRAMGLQYLTGEGDPRQLEVCDQAVWPDVARKAA